eukprot:CAMPEP_0197389590 /NCGR_PEP_ID=MMETSP1165-20131217/1812_1 /TAXON_ID=284809 /ORGANISM="Chrysocystis fragilis, Strain CCMP3189" /LENGTH=53 /DNA_ID=CAMNT_0042915011 /DNA_START=13 /DNA_END=174 /DNA_ORIENTATION=-
MTTTCCVNNRKSQDVYRLFIDQPCNAAASTSVSHLAIGIVVSVAVMRGRTLAT